MDILICIKQEKCCKGLTPVISQPRLSDLPSSESVSILFAGSVRLLAAPDVVGGAVGVGAPGSIARGGGGGNGVSEVGKKSGLCCSPAVLPGVAPQPGIVIVTSQLLMQACYALCCNSLYENREGNEDGVRCWRCCPNQALQRG